MPWRRDGRFMRARPGAPGRHTATRPGNGRVRHGAAMDEGHAMTTATSTVRKSADREGFRQAMSWLHTWAGLILGWLLFAIFLTGTLSFFNNEFNLWMRPEMHGLPRTDAADAQVAQKSVDALVRKAPDVTQWILHLPDDRD